MEDEARVVDLNSQSRIINNKCNYRYFTRKICLLLLAEAF